MLLSRPCARRLAISRVPPKTSPPHILTPLARDYSDSRSPSSTTNYDVGILGGGLTGLASAYFVTRDHPNAKVTIYESKNRVGGWLESKRVPVKDGNVLFEGGPRTIRPQSNGILTARLMQELGLTKDAIFTQTTAPAALNRYVYYPDHLVRMPHPSFGLAENVWSMLTDPVFKGAVWGMATEMWTKPRDPSVQDESVGDFISRRVGKDMVERIVSAIYHGIYAGDVWQLSARSLMPTQWRDEAQHGTIIGGAIHARAHGVDMSQREANFLQHMKDFTWDPLLKATLKNTSVFTFKDGITMLADRLYTKLFESGRVEFKTGTPVESIAQAEGNSGILVKAATSSGYHTHTHVISALLPGHLNGVAGAELVKPIPTVTAMSVNLYYRTPGLAQPGFGHLIPRATPFENNPERALGVIYDNAYSPSAADANPENWNNLTTDQLKAARNAGQLVNVNDFAWYNMPEPPNIQDNVPVRGTKLTVMFGGHWWDNWPAYPDQKEGLALARSALERQLGIKEDPEAWQVNLQKDCIPQYVVGHEQKLKDAHNAIWRTYRGRLRVAGGWISGVGMNDCIRSAYEVSKNLASPATGLDHIGEELNVRLKPVKG